MNEASEIHDITIDRAAQRMSVVFGDGFSYAFSLQDLREHCPCAGCRGDREHGRAAWPKPSSPLPLSVNGAEFVGAWGLSITWNDNHSAGIFPFSSLRAWADAGEPSLQPDSGFGA